MLRKPSRHSRPCVSCSGRLCRCVQRNIRGFGNNTVPNKETAQHPGAASNNDKAAEVVAAVEALYDTLDDDLLEEVTYDLDDEKRRNWSNLPVNILDFERNGIRMGDLNEEQLASVFAVLETSLSKEGFEKVRQIVRATRSWRNRRLLRPGSAGQKTTTGLPCSARLPRRRPGHGNSEDTTLL